MISFFLPCRLSFQFVARSINIYSNWLLLTFIMQRKFNNIQIENAPSLCFSAFQYCFIAMWSVVNNAQKNKRRWRLLRFLKYFWTFTEWLIPLFRRTPFFNLLFHVNIVRKADNLLTHLLPMASQIVFKISHNPL